MSDVTSVNDAHSGVDEEAPDAESATAPADVSRTIRGLIRSAEAVDSLLERIRAELADGFLPQKSLLSSVLQFDKTITEKIEDFIYEDLVVFEQWDTVTKTFTGMALALTQLEGSLVDLRRAVTWSSRFSGFNWWLRTRQREMGVEDHIVIAGPGGVSAFRIERFSSVARNFEQANRFLKLTDEHLASLSMVRILTVPQNDGASARWHAISLGHELAHLRYDTDWILGWLATFAEALGAEAQQAVALAANTSQSPTVDRWFENLCAWLVESSCDAAMLRYYGTRSIETLATYLSVHSTDNDGLDHPGPEPRLVALRATQSDELDRFKIGAGAEAIHVQHRRNAYCELILPVRDAVLSDLGQTAQSIARIEAVEALALAALNNDMTPGSNDWDVQWVKDDPNSVEAGLVGSLWAVAPDDISHHRTDRRVMALHERRIEHAVDFLQFLHRFETRRDETGVLEPHPSARPSNVLYLTSSGVFTDSADVPVAAPGPHENARTPGGATVIGQHEQHSQGEQQEQHEKKATPPQRAGVAAHDVRLGRHFIVFRRNQIATLNALDTDRESRQAQELVEIGWGDTFVLHPAEMVLAVTLESMVLSRDCTAQVLSRSSLGRMGLLSATAVQVQPGFRGCLTLELVNLASVPLRLSPGQRVAQIVPSHALGTALHFEDKYQDQDWKPRFSAVSHDWEMPVLKTLRGDPELHETPQPQDDEMGK